MFYPAIVTPDDGAFVVTFPDAPGCVTQVDAADQVLPMATEALAGWLDATLDAGDVLPEVRPRRRAPRGSRTISVPVLPSATALRILLRRARAEDGLTSEALAERLGMPVHAVRRLEGRGANPTLETVDRVAYALNRTPVLGFVREGATGGYLPRVVSPRRGGR